ncbi:hypothetical protein Q5752_004597 [Cryptotrichosporon argae]
MLAPTAARSLRASLARPALSARLQPRLAADSVVARRWNTTDTGPRGGKSKLIFRFGLKDIPVELYPVGFIVSVAVVGGLVGTCPFRLSRRFA